MRTDEDFRMLSGGSSCTRDMGYTRSRDAANRTSGARGPVTGGHRLRRGFGVVMAVLGAVAVACGDPTGPTEPLVVTLTTSPTFGPVLFDEGDGASIRCGFRMIATASGRGRADWQGAVIRFYAGMDRSTPIDTAFLSEEDILGAWSRDSIFAGRADTAEWHLTAGIPFEAEFSFAYFQRGATVPAYAAARGRCGPVPSAALDPPTTSLVEIRTSDPELNVGDTVFVTYDAASANGLWQSGAAISGPFERTTWLADTLREVARHTIAFVVPPGSRLDLPLSALLLADDISLRRTTELHTTAIRLVDRTPPSAFVWASEARVPTGATIAFTISAEDDNAVRTLVWSLEGEIAASDSITLVDALPSTSREIVVTVRPEWAGKRARLRVRAYDDAGQRSADWTTDDGTYRFHESFAAPSATFAFDAPGLPDFQAYDPVHGRFYGTFSDAGRVVGVALSAMVPLPPIVLAGAAAIAIAPSGDSLFVGTRNSRTLRVLSPNTGVSVGTIPLTALDSIIPPGTQPAAAPDWIAPLLGGRVLVHVASVQGVVEIDLSTGAQRYRRGFEPPEGGTVGFLATDRQRVLLIAPTCHRWYLALSDSLTPCRPGTGVDPRFVSLPLGGDGAGLGTQIVDGELTPVGPADVQGMSIPDSDGVHHWNADAWDGRIYKVRSADGAIQRSTPLPGQSWFLRFLPDGRSLIVLGWGGLTRFDLGAP